MRSRDAFRHPSSAKALQNERPFVKTKGAERRKAQSVHDRIGAMRQRPKREPLAFRRPTAALTKRLTAWLNSGPRFLELPGANGRTLPGASAASTSQAGPNAGRYDARSRPGAKLRASPAGTALAPFQDRL
jgi:hypothetical protein